MPPRDELALIFDPVLQFGDLGVAIAAVAGQQLGFGLARHDTLFSFGIMAFLT